MTSYKEFSEIYDNLMDDIPYNKWTSFIKNKIGTKKLDILEAACGTGNITNLLAEENYKIIAIDNSENMLVQAYKKLRKFKNITILNQNMINFKINMNFDAIICCCDGINYLVKEKELINFFNNTFCHLKEEGKLIFDISTEYKYNHILGNNTFVYDNNDIFYVWENSLNKNEKTIDIEINFFKKYEYDKYKRIIEIQKQKIHDIDELIKILKNVGYKNIHIYDDYNNKTHNDKTERAVFYCEK